MEIFIVRHGETLWNREKRIQGSADIELSDYGRELAQKTAEGMKDIRFDRIISSPLVRAQETAKILRGSRNVPVETDPRIKEMSFGIYEGCILSETPGLQLFFDDPENYRAPEGGEVFRELLDRTADFMKNTVEPMAAAHDTERLLIVSHGAAISAIMCYVRQMGIRDFWSSGLCKNCGAHVLKLDENGYEIIEESRIYY